MDHFFGRGCRTRTYACSSQSAMPYRLGESPKCGERTGIRTPDTRLRRALLYPAELCTHIHYYFNLERETRFELPTASLARLRSTTELFPHLLLFYKVVRMKGVEPPRRRRQILSLVRLPIPPHPQLYLWWRMVDSNHRKQC